MCKTLYDELISQQHFSKCAHWSFCKSFICNFLLRWVSIRRNPLYYILFGSKHIGVSDTQKSLFNFMLITRHNTRPYDLELHTIAIKHCLGVRQPHVQYFIQSQTCNTPFLNLFFITTWKWGHIYTWLEKIRRNTRDIVEVLVNNNEENIDINIETNEQLQ